MSASTSTPPGPPEQPPPQPQTETPQTPLPLHQRLFNHRSPKQLGTFAAGAAFLTLSVLITRRSLLRKYKSTIPAFYQHTNHPTKPVNGAGEAFEALNLATLNVTSVAIMLTGGCMWALDVSTIDDVRRRFRSAFGVDNIERTSGVAADQEIEEWLAGVLARKELKEAAKRQAAEKMAQAGKGQK